MQGEWKVCFDAGFRGDGRDETLCSEVPVRGAFRWAEREWIVPAVYIGEKGVVLDFCMRAEAEDLQSFLQKWRFAEEQRLSREQRLQIEAENPLVFEFNPVLIVNGQRYLRSGSSSKAYIPPEIYAEECGSAADVLEHYGLDASSGWNFRRVKFPWKAAPQGKIQSLSIEMEQSSMEIPGAKFRISEAGQTFEFLHPTTGQSHVLTIQSLKPVEIPAGCIPEPDLDFPNKCLAAEYTIAPNLPDGAFFLRDCIPNDLPRDKAGNPVPNRGGAIGLIARARNKANRSFISSLHFDVIKAIEAQISFNETQFPKDTFLILKN